MKQRHHSSAEPWWKDPSALGDVIAIVAALIATFISIIDLLDLLEIGWFNDNLAKLTLLLVSFVVISSVAERRLLINRLQTSLIDEIRTLRTGPYKGLTHIYANRDQLPSFYDIVQDAAKEILIAGVEFGYIALHEIPTLEKKALSGCKIKLLLVDPGTDDQPSSLIEPLQETLAFPQMGELLKTNLRRLSFWKSRLSPTVSKRVEIRTTKSVPMHIVVFVDKDLTSGMMQLEMIPPKTEPRERWLVVIEAGKGGDLYTRYVKAYEELWNEAQPWEQG